MKKLPLARSKDIAVQELVKEILIYDLKSHKAYNLNESSSIIYKACDGKTTFVEFSVKTNLNESIIFLTLDKLKTLNLLKEGEDYNSPFTGMSRREVIRKVGFASLAALPVIASIVAPTTAMAASSTCINPVSCAPGELCLPSGGVNNCVDCACTNPGACLTKTSCPSLNNCNPSGICAP